MRKEIRKAIIRQDALCARAAPAEQVLPPAQLRLAAAALHAHCDTSTLQLLGWCVQIGLSSLLEFLEKYRRTVNRSFASVCMLTLAVKTRHGKA